MTISLLRHLRKDYSQVLEAIFGIMLASGIKSAAILSTCSNSVKRAEAKRGSRVNEESNGLVAAALVLDAWHRDRRYLSEHGLPKPVRLLGRAPSVEALIRAHMGRAGAARIARKLRDLELVVCAGRSLYEPMSDVAILSTRNPLVLQHTAQVLATLLQTVGRNVSSGKSAAPLIERVAEIPDLPRKHLADFQEFTQTQGRNFVRTINDWLVARRATSTRGRRRSGTVRAGIHTYAYVAPKVPNTVRYLNGR
jgi:hypothetical protein